MSYLATKAVLAAILLSVSVGLMAETPTVEKISDPLALHARGFDPNGPPIYRLVQSADERSLDARIEEREQLEAQRALAGPRSHEVSWVSVQATDFQFLRDQNLYTTQGNHTLSCLPTANRFADAPVHLARNRRLLYLDVWTRDDSADHDVDVALYQACQPLFAGGVPEITELGLIQGSGSPGERFQWINLPDVQVQNRTCTYWVRAMFSSCAGNTDVQVQKVQVIWE
jgi:hypothetical protein